MSCRTPTGRYIQDYQFAQGVASQLANVGIKAQIQTTDWPSYVRWLTTPLEQTPLQIFVLGWATGYLDADGERRVVTSDDVNQYLRDASGEDYTAKDFRTWAGTVLAATALRELANFESETEAKRNVISGIDSVARKLGHTRAVCRRAYVHPAVIEAYMDRSLEDALRGNVAKTFLRLGADEAAVVALLRRSMKNKPSKR